jgi:hypothetical protein
MLVRAEARISRGVTHDGEVATQLPLFQLRRLDWMGLILAT